MARSRIYSRRFEHIRWNDEKYEKCESKKFDGRNIFQIVTEQMKNQIREKVACRKTLHRVSGNDTRKEDSESGDTEEGRLNALWRISEFSLKQKTFS